MYISTIRRHSISRAAAVAHTAKTLAGAKRQATAEWGDRYVGHVIHVMRDGKTVAARLICYRRSHWYNYVGVTINHI